MMSAISEKELQALIAILARAPLTPAEALWLQGLLDRLAQTMKAQAATQNPSDPFALDEMAI